MMDFMRRLLTAERKMMNKTNSPLKGNSSFVARLMCPIAEKRKSDAFVLTVDHLQNKIKEEERAIFAAVCQKGNVPDTWTRTPGSEKQQPSVKRLLDDERDRKLFHEFLKSEFSEENLEFWVACEEFKTLSGKRKRASKAKKIYNQYVNTGSPKMVNLDSTTRSAISLLLTNPQPDIFNQAQKRIQYLMEHDSYRRFEESDSYKQTHSYIASTKYGLNPR